jgi:hypothetical protein
MNARILVAALFLLASCDGITNRQGRGPIALGDPGTIVTETDTQYLQSMDPDPAFETPDSSTRPSATRVVTAPQRDTAVTTTPSKPAATPVPSGLTADFGDVQITLPGIAARDDSKSVRGARSAAYTLSGTSFAGKTIAVRGGTVKRIQQRTGYSGIVDINGKSLLISDFGPLYDNWQSLRGASGDYTVAPTSPPNVGVLPATVRTAVQKVARRQRLDRKSEQKLLRSLKSFSVPPLSMVPRVYLWKIEGADAKGKAFSKELRLDVPL